MVLDQIPCEDAVCDRAGRQLIGEPVLDDRVPLGTGQRSQLVSEARHYDKRPDAEPARSPTQRAILKHFGRVASVLLT